MIPTWENVACGPTLFEALNNAIRQRTRTVDTLRDGAPVPPDENVISTIKYCSLGAGKFMLCRRLNAADISVTMIDYLFVREPHFIRSVGLFGLNEISGFAGYHGVRVRTSRTGIGTTFWQAVKAAYQVSAERVSDSAVHLPVWHPSP